MDVLPPSARSIALNEQLGSFPERELIRRWQVHRDRRAQEELVRRFLPAARQLARRYARAHESIDDLTQAATVGLIAAIERFDLSRQTSLSTYAFPTMSGELKRYLRNTRWAVHMPRGMQERTLDVRSANERLIASLDRSPTPAELGGALGLPVEEVLEALVAEGARTPASLEAPRHDEEEASSLGETVGSSDEGFELVDDRSAVIGALRTLPERERRIIELRFGSEMTQSEIARHVGVSQMQVSRLMRRAIGRMRIVAAGDDAATLEEAGAA